jgi:hypothetical protein
MPGQREQFQQRVDALVNTIESLVDRSEWATRRYPKRFRDEAREPYEVTALFLQRGPVKLLVDPIGYDVPGAEGAADIYVMPAYDPAASVYFEGGRWVIHYAFAPDPGRTHSVIETQELPVSDDSLNRVLDDIVDHVGT